MAIKRAKKEAEILQEFDAKFDSDIRNAFTAQVLSKQYEAEFKDYKADVLTYLETNDDGFEVELGKAFKHPCGSINIQTRKSYVYDKDALAAMVASGALDLGALLELCKPKDSEIKTLLGTKKFAEVAEEKCTESVVFKATPAVKDEIAEMFQADHATRAESKVVISEPVKAKVKKKAIEAKAKAPKKGVITKELENVDDEINSILASAKKIKSATKRS
jgi:hypothetical protein